ncbi:MULTISPECIES: GGDEF domain-containing protein [unclassified Duganella]|uniref:GGDEF domain-containing protein n=1 Tax=unclassified Duganella TaxID=2636909 RepID=UPI0008883319|nr:MULTISPECIES: GGDEF domain-containing protein [unclassified Duganella]SDG56065.1 diguanylate cyclase (GGDEF) domain-containing protein [Duganella sp. OV458]SDJ78905.1 diguanylate cyclase (GGDEF) domain-containing protein [Duganella sp. OV510]
MLNLDTLLLVQVCVALLTTGLLVASACYTESPPEQRWWAGGNVAVTLGMALSNVQTLPLLLTGVVGYGVIAFGLGLVLRGLRVYCAETLSWTSIAAITGVALAITGYYALVVPSLQARLGFSGFYFALLNWVCALAVARHGNWRVTSICVAGFTLLGLALFLRGVHMLLHADPGENASSLVIALSALIVPLAQICIAFGLILMVMWRYAERLRRLSTLDALTGAMNRAGLEIQGKRVGLRALRGGRSLTVIMIDVDCFKNINDTYGHPVGDEVLRHLAKLLKLELRPHDLLARFGGEEFVLVLDGVNLEAALSVAERLRARIEHERVELEKLSVRYTASMGVVCSDQHDYDLIRLISAGDAAMYQAKRAGRNRVVAG